MGLYTYARFAIQGHVGKITALNNALKVHVADTDRWTDRDTGEVKERTKWNTITLFSRHPGFEIVKSSLAVGDLIMSRGGIEETSYDKDGQTVYGVALVAEDFAIVPTGRGK